MMSKSAFLVPALAAGAAVVAGAAALLGWEMAHRERIKHASESGRQQKGPAEEISGCRLFWLEPAVLGRIWPAERVVLGIRTCKQLRRDLNVHPSSTALVPKAGATLSESCVSKDLSGPPEHAKVALSCQITDGAIPQASVLGECKALAHLDTSDNWLGGVEVEKPVESKVLAHPDILISAEGAGFLGEMLAEGKALTLTHLNSLNLSKTWIGDEGAGKLARLLGECKALERLDLSCNGIGDEGLGSLAGVLGECKALAHLDLRLNWIGDEGAGHLAGVLGGCKALAHLVLRCNSLGDDGAGMLAGVLEECKALAHLDLVSNRIGDEGARRLAGALGGCKALARLDLRHNDISDKGLRVLAGVLGECTTLAC